MWHWEPQAFYSNQNFYSQFKPIIILHTVMCSCMYISISFAQRAIKATDNWYKHKEPLQNSGYIINLVSGPGGHRPYWRQSQVTWGTGLPKLGRMALKLKTRGQRKDVMTHQANQCQVLWTVVCKVLVSFLLYGLGESCIFESPHFYMVLICLCAHVFLI